MKIHCKYDELVKTENLKPHPKNRNKHSEEQIDRLAKILKYQGIRAPIVVSKLSGHIVKGHGTLMAIVKNGWQGAPVVYQEFESSDVEYAFVQSDNAIASWAELDIAEIKNDLIELSSDFDDELLGLKEIEIQEIEINEKEVDENLPTDKECPSCGYKW